ncbi:unnamed protein product [Blepharisma stoltei]|uniref:non-specific serine/threonine protein kinase n=1 Tax=Blepharisma stoltei TaxID=1481888 RepID=A0AAU9K3X7_9CILI|nr:unnamed protein product [Blepharisma stoltei]
MGICFRKEHNMRAPMNAGIIASSSLSKSARTENIRDKYEFIKVVGYGQFGTVREARLKIHNGSQECEKIFAIKSICKGRVVRLISCLRNEIEILMLVDHPNIIKLYEAYEDTKYIHLVMEMCTGGDILEFLLAKGSLSEEEIAKIMHKMLAAVNHLHSLHICHRDLKPENFLLESHDEHAELRLIDFGMSIKYGEDLMYSLVGTPYYQAPDIFKGIYGDECDVWSLGVILYFLLSGKQPFKSANISELHERINRGIYSFSDIKWKTISPEAKHLIRRMLTVDPKKRISIKAALSHPWFKIKNQPSGILISQDIFKSIKRFKAPSKLWQELMTIFVRNISQENTENLKLAFQDIDVNKVGFVTAQDIANAMRRCGYKILSDEISNLIEKIDYLGNGRLNYTQFLIAAVDRKQLIDDECVWSIFKHFDITGNGKIKVEDLKFTLEKAGCFTSNEEINEIIEEFKLRGEDGMDYEKLREIMMCFSEEYTEVNTESDFAFDGSPHRRLSLQRLAIRKRTFFNKNQNNVSHENIELTLPNTKTYSL